MRRLLELQSLLAGFATEDSACPSTESAIDAAAFASFETRGPVLRDGIIASLRTCGCDGLDLDAIESLVATMTGGPDVRCVGLNLAPSSDEAARRVALEPNASMQELLSALIAEPTEVWIEIVEPTP